jgi:hypothetical protein
MQLKHLSRRVQAECSGQGNSASQRRGEAGTPWSAPVGDHTSTSPCRGVLLILSRTWTHLHHGWQHRQRLHAGVYWSSSPCTAFNFIFSSHGRHPPPLHALAYWSSPPSPLPPSSPPRRYHRHLLHPRCSSSSSPCTAFNFILSNAGATVIVSMRQAPRHPLYPRPSSTSRTASNAPRRSTHLHLPTRTPSNLTHHVAPHTRRLTHHVTHVTHHVDNDRHLSMGGITRISHTRPQAGRGALRRQPRDGRFFTFFAPKLAFEGLKAPL